MLATMLHLLYCYINYMSLCCNVTEVISYIVVLFQSIKLLCTRNYINAINSNFLYIVDFITLIILYLYNYKGVFIFGLLLNC
jgi:hypothetical protein